MKNILKSNSVLISFYAIYFLSLWNYIFKESIVLLIIIHAVLMLIALSPIGENIMKTINGVKKIRVEEDKEYLYPLFIEVYEQAKQENKNLSNNIQLYVNESKMPNAFACGSNTVCITRGAINTFSSEELKGILAHEIGHISNGDTKILLMFLIGNAVFMFFALFFKLAFLIGEIIMSMFDENSIKVKIMRGIRFLITNAVLLIVGAIFSLNSRIAEKEADRFASDIGYNQELKSALLVLRKIDNSAPQTIMDRIYASHPDLELRISKLEQME